MLQMPSPHAMMALQLPLSHCFPLGQPQSWQHVAWVSLPSQTELPQLGGTSHTPPTHSQPLPQPQSCGQLAQSSFKEQVPSPHGAGGAPQSAGHV